MEMIRRVDDNQDDDTMMRLYEASRRGSVAELESLIRRDQHILHRISLTSMTETPLHISALLGHVDFTRALVTKKPGLAAEPDSLKCSPLHLAAAEGHAEIVKELLSVNTEVCLAADEDGRIPLHLAAMRGRVQVIQELIDSRPESIRVAHDGFTVLHLCVRHNHLEALKLLMSRGSHDELCNSKDSDGNTILHLAVMLKQVQTVEYLVSGAATATGERDAELVNVQNNNGLTAVDVLELQQGRRPRDFKSLEIREILIEAGGGSGGLIRRSSAKHKQNSDVDDLQQTTKSKCRTFLRWLERKLRYQQGNWMEETRGSLMVVASLIATMTFSAAINPPGGVWQQTSINKLDNCTEAKPCKAGTAVLAYAYPEDHFLGALFNTLSFVASFTVVLLLISGFPLENKATMWILTVTMIVAVTSMTLTYSFTLIMVTPDHLLLDIFWVTKKIIILWFFMLALLTLFLTIRFFYWMVRKFKRVMTKVPNSSCFGYFHNNHHLPGTNNA